MTHHLPDGEVKMHEVMGWAQEQTEFLTPTQTLVLWYLCINAWHTPDNPEGAPVGQVLSGRTALRKIVAGTGLSQRAVRYALDDLQDSGYVWCKHLPGKGQSRVVVFWTESADEARRDFRTGAAPLPEGFRRESPKPKKELTVVPDAIILPFRSGK